jgi:hypothetical protein
MERLHPAGEISEGDAMQDAVDWAMLAADRRRQRDGFLFAL